MHTFKPGDKVLTHTTRYFSPKRKWVVTRIYDDFNVVKVRTKLKKKYQHTSNNGTVELAYYAHELTHRD